MEVCNVVTWNIAAINNNPFEYWITHPDPEYNALMKNVQEFIDNPGAMDIKLEEICGNDIISELMEAMREQNLQGVEEVEGMWKQTYSQKKGIQEFLLDKSIGVKRLTSMPDRITNTIHNVDGSTALRPSVLSAYDEDMSSVEVWWLQWKEFMFRREVKVHSRDGNEGPRIVCQLIEPILRSKYPAISQEEQAVSIPLQILCLFLFDAVLVHLLNTVAKKSWQHIKRSLSQALVRQKASRTITIIAERYSAADIIFIQEAAAAFYPQLSQQEVIQKGFAVLRPNVLDGKRDQNSFILVSRRTFEEESAVEITDEVLECIGGKWLAPGDLLAVTIRSRAGGHFLLASFHGDSNGLSTQPFVEALDQIAQTRYPAHRVVVGLDANTLSADEPLHFSVGQFHALLQSLDMVSCWADTTDRTLTTTCNARTCLQAQVNKAVRFVDRIRKGQRNLKDWIIFYPAQFAAAEVARDNTGDRLFVPDMVFPTIAFPSDHALVSVALLPRPLPQSTDARVASADAASLNDACAIGDEVQPFEEQRVENGTHLHSASSNRFRRRRWLEIPQYRESRGGASDWISAQATLYDYWNIAARPEELRVEAPLAACKALWSPRDSGQQAAFLREQLRDMTLRPPDALDRVNRSLSAARNRADAVWVLFASNPLSLALCKPKVILALVGPGICDFAWTGLGFFLAAQGGVMDGAKAYRFTVSGDCTGGQTNLTAMIKDAGLLINGRPLLEGLLHVAVTNASVVISSTVALPCNGWWMRADPDTLQRCPLHFSREHSRDGVLWDTTPDSVWQVTHGYLQSLNPPFATAQDGSVAMYDYSPPWQWMLGYLGCIDTLALGLVATLCFGAWKKGEEGVLSLAVCFLASAIFRTVAMVASINVGRQADGLLFGLWLIYDIWNCAYFACTERIFAPNELDLVAFTVYMGFMEGFDRTSIHANDAGSGMWVYEITPIRASIPVFLGLSTLLMHIRSSTARWILDLTKEDREMFNSTWSSFIVGLSEDGKSALQSILITTGQMAEKCKFAVPVLQRLRVQSLNRSGLVLSTNSRVDNFARLPDHRYLLGPPVKSLDQLFAQAAGLQYFLIAKVQQWALASHGCFLFESDDGTRSFEPWENIYQDPEARRKVQWAAIKSPERALEKLLRSLNNKPSRLLDCCRQRIVFREPGHLLLCLEAVQRDGEVRVLQVKNRLHDGYDGSATAGYRDIVLNLRIETAETERLGVETHICELQLSFCCFAQLITSESHSRYLILRNIRRLLPLLRELVLYFPRLFSHANSISFLATHRDISKSPVPPPSFFPDAEPACPSAESIDTSLHTFMRCDTAQNPGYNADMDKSQQLRDLIEGLYLTRCQRQPMAELTRQHVVWKTISEESFISLLLSKSPISAALSRPRIQLFCLALGILFVCQFSLNLHAFMSSRLVEGRSILITAAASLRYNASAAAGASDTFFLQKDGFIVDTSPSSIYSNGSSGVVIEYSKPIKFNGWRIHLDDDNIVNVGLALTLDGHHWSCICSSDGACFPEPNVLSSVPMPYTRYQDQGYHTYDLRVPWVFFVDSVLPPVFESAMMTALAWNGWKGNSHFSPWIIAGGNILIFMCYSMSAIQGFLVQQIDEACVLAILAIGNCLWCAGSIFYEDYMLQILLLHGFVLVLVSLINWLFESNTRLSLDVSFPFLGCIELAAWSIVSIGRLGMHIAVMRRDRSNSLRYNNIWRQIRIHDSGTGHLRKIFEATRAMSLPLEPDLRQRGRPNLNTSLSEVLLIEENVNIQIQEGEYPLILSLDQLFAQAAGLAQFLITKVQQWALASHGCFPFESDDGTRSFEPWENIYQDPEARRKVQWAAIKSPERALEKLLRSLNNKPSRLLDCCRQRIVFREPGHLLLCLEAVQRDGEVRVLQVKNRLHDGYDGSATAGYRDIVLNLRIETAETERLGVERHICELRMGLIEFENL